MKSIPLLGVIGLGLIAGGVSAERYTIDSKAEWERWTFPRGLVEATENGSLRLIRVQRVPNVVADAGEFKEDGSIVRAGSNLTSAGQVADGDEDTGSRGKVMGLTGGGLI